MSNKKIFIINTAPGKEYGEQCRFWQGCPTILRTPGGRLFAGWYSGGIGEPSLENYNLLVRSEDNGMTWSAPELVISGRPEENYSAIDIQLWLDPAGRMWLFFVKMSCCPGSSPSDPDHWTTWAMVCENPDAPVLCWSGPRPIVTGFLRNQPTVLSNGDWVMCAYDRSSEYLCYARSRDRGKTWERCRAALVSKDTPAANRAKLDEYRWMVEEFRISVFAPELKTSVPVSEKRLDALWPAF